MDEICTARNASQGRCACAERTKSFAKAQDALDKANEELIQLSGQLTLLVATKGKDVSAAFQLTDAEKVMNCVSWKETAAKGDKKLEDAWCEAHGVYTNCGQPTYCDKNNNTFGFDIDSLSKETSEITALLTSWDTAKTAASSATEDDTNSLVNSYTNLIQAATNIGLVVDEANNSKDKLTTLWGYDLFEYAHNNICGRVLDTCFNGIYEACGSVPSGGRCADSSSGTASCPYNYNSKVSVTGTDGVKEVVVNERSKTGSNIGATCYGYSSTSGDPYSTLRGPVADARRSVLQKYLLDANAACDAYGDQLTTTAQNIAYQKVAAQQALQQKRLEFAQEEEATILADVSAAKQNYINCLDEIQTCRYDVQRQYANQGWTTNRIRSYCNTKTQVPICYETMVCEQNATRVVTADDEDNDSTLTQNTVTLADILSLNDGSERSKCINKDMNVSEIRSFGSTDESSQSCVPTNGTVGYQNWDSENLTWGECQATQCKTGYRVTMVGTNRKCQLPANANESPESTTLNDFVPLVGAKCQNGYIAKGGNCVSAQCGPQGAVYSEACTTDKIGTIGCVSTGCLCQNDKVLSADGKCEDKTPPAGSGDNTDTE